MAKTSKLLLQEQIKTRIQMGNSYPVSVIGAEYRSDKKPYKIRWTKPKESVKSEVAYLTDLALAMVTYDTANGIVTEVPVADLVRSLPQISSEHTSAKGKNLRAKLRDKMYAAAEPQDDALAVELLQEYKGKLLYVNDDEAWPSQTFRVIDVQFYKGEGSYHDCWEATCEPVERCDSGSWRVPSKFLVPGDYEPPLVQNQYLYGVMVASLEDPENPKRVPYADEYIALHEDRTASSALGPPSLPFFFLLLFGLD